MKAPAFTGGAVRSLKQRHGCLRRASCKGKARPHQAGVRLHTSRVRSRAAALAAGPSTLRHRPTAPTPRRAGSRTPASLRCGICHHHAGDHLQVAPFQGWRQGRLLGTQHGLARRPVRQTPVRQPTTSKPPQGAGRHAFGARRNTLPGTSSHGSHRSPAPHKLTPLPTRLACCSCSAMPSTQPCAGQHPRSGHAVPRAPMGAHATLLMNLLYPRCAAIPAILPCDALLWRAALAWHRCG